ncbi:MAG TPA: hypothetical protein VGH87_27615 [Polyangiaceae bacterium]|nr:hypothetical protein [Polyangiaceae bacterium]
MRTLLIASTLLVLACDKPSDSTTGAASASASASAPAASGSAGSLASASASAHSMSPPVAASPADPADAKLAAFVADVAQNIVNAAVGKPVDAKWIAKDPQQKISNLTDPDDKRLLDALGKDLTIVAVEMEVGLLAQPAPNEHHEVNARVIMLGDKTVRWGTVGSRHETSALQDPTPGLDKSAPTVVEAANRLSKALAGPCTMPWAAMSDLSAAPTHIQTEFSTDMGATKHSCGEVAKVKGEWRAHIDDVRVLVKGTNGKYGFLSSVFDVEEPGDKLVLSPLHAEVLDEAGMKK